MPARRTTAIRSGQTAVKRIVSLREGSVKMGLVDVSRVEANGQSAATRTVARMENVF